MPIPIYTKHNLSNIKDIEAVAKWENDDPANRCISFWEYLQLIIDMDDAHYFDQIGNNNSSNLKKALRELYLADEPMSSQEIATNIGLAKAINVHGAKCFGGLGKEMYKRYVDKFNEYPYTKDKLWGNVYLQMFLDLILCKDTKNKQNNGIYFCIKSRFKAALTQHFTSNVIHNWP